MLASPAACQLRLHARRCIPLDHADAAPLHPSSALPPARQFGAESEDEDDAARDGEGSESGASDDEADEEGGKGASDGGEGGREGGEGGREGGDGGREGGEGKKKGPKNDYDYMDEFIDDEGEGQGREAGREGGRSRMWRRAQLVAQAVGGAQPCHRRRGPMSTLLTCHSSFLATRQPLPTEREISILPLLPCRVHTAGGA